MPKLWLEAAPLLWLATASSAFALAPAASLPPHGKPGECYARMVKPAVYGTETHQVIDKPAWTETRVVPARTEIVVERVLVTPEVVERAWREPVYREEVRWEAAPGASRWVHEPPRYQHVQEQVALEPGRYEWRRSFNGYTEVICKVWLPPRYGVIDRKVMVSPGRDYEVAEPPIRKKVVIRSLVGEGGWSERRTPAVYRSETHVRVVQPEHIVSIPHPAVYRTVASPVLVTPGREEWVRVTCRHPEPPVRLPPPPPREIGERG